MDYPQYTQGVGDYSVSAGPFVGPVSDYADMEGSSYLPQFGADATLAPGPQSMTTSMNAPIKSLGRTIYYWTATTVAVLAAYHGYKRNDGSVGWAFGWAIFGSAMPFFAAPLMLAEGFGKLKYKTTVMPNKRGKKRKRKGS